MWGGFSHTSDTRHSLNHRPRTPPMLQSTKRDAASCLQRGAPSTAVCAQKLAQRLGLSVCVCELPFRDKYHNCTAPYGLYEIRRHFPYSIVCDTTCPEPPSLLLAPRSCCSVAPWPFPPRGGQLPCVGTWHLMSFRSAGEVRESDAAADDDAECGRDEAQGAGGRAVLPCDRG